MGYDPDDKRGNRPVFDLALKLVRQRMRHFPSAKHDMRSTLVGPQKF